MVEIITDMEAYREQAIEAIGGGIAFQPQGPDGELFTVPHPLLLSEPQNEALAEAQGNSAVAQVLLNTEADPDVHARFIAAGGRSGDVLLAWRQLSTQMNAPKNAPK